MIEVRVLKDNRYMPGVALKKEERLSSVAIPGFEFVVARVFGDLARRSLES